MNLPRFYCENCGAEVTRDAKVCRSCGRFFSSVRCPRCGFFGQPAKFKEGCPKCGYSKFGQGMDLSLSSDPPPRAGAMAPLPIWVYFAAVGALVAAVALLLVVAFS